ncbi:NAD-dependent succinate-semialdehyde dehydrogenase [Gammaproteobacteria bacterium SCGC AG-212-F23]|nr:NAD-dependent succinate-semialdehyde dehydrogenase [Gammaproteobacteria bacterium SCGC AG-212-F23]
MNRLKNPALFRQQCYINGQWMDANKRKTFTVKNPFDQQVLGTVPDCGVEEAQIAILAANEAWKTWRVLTAKQRADYLWQWHALIAKNKEDLATIMTLEQGKPINESRGEIDYANAFIRWFAEEARRVYGDIIPSNIPGQHLLVIKQAIGVAACITPWNFPAAMITRKCAPALAAGCPIIIKPAEDTPYTALALAVLAEEAGIPKGVLNIITGNPEKIGGEFTKNPLVRKLSFTGSTKVGKLLMQQSATTVKKLSLELGGNAPFIVFDDADINAAISGLIACKFRNTGQTCVCANRIYVQAKIYDEFSKKLMVAVKDLQVGNGLDEKTQQGPLINHDAIEKVKRHVADALAKGANLLCGGKPIGKNTLFFEPTVLTNVNNKMLLSHEEIFGPVAALFRFETEEEAITMANATEYGLAAYFYTQNMQRTWRVSEALECGIIAINSGIFSTEVAPFGGFKESGIGREGSKYGIEEYLEIKYLCMV